MFRTSLWVQQKCTSCLFCEIPLWVTLPLPSASTIYVRQGPIIWQAGEVAKIFARSMGPGSDMINIFLIVHIRGKEGDITQMLGCSQQVWQGLPIYNFSGSLDPFLSFMLSGSNRYFHSTRVSLHKPAVSARVSIGWDDITVWWPLLGYRYYLIGY